MSALEPQQTCTGKLKERGEEVQRLYRLADVLDGRGALARASAIRKDARRMQDFWRFELSLERVE